MGNCYDRMYNYVYLIKNKINKMIYIGVHKTDNLEDGYMGSGTKLKKDQVEYGIENFTKSIICFCNSYKEALAVEQQLVNRDFVLNENTYNQIIGGCHVEGSVDLFLIMSKAQKLRFKGVEARAQISENMKKIWARPGYKEKMINTIYENEDRNKKVSDGIKRWIENHPQEHKARMEKINKNLSKIEKMANSHRGAIRTESAKNNIKDGIRNYIKNNPEDSSIKHGKGCVYIHNETLNLRKRINKLDNIPDGWKLGLGPRKNGRR